MSVYIPAKQDTITITVYVTITPKMQKDGYDQPIVSFEPNAESVPKHEGNIVHVYKTQIHSHHYMADTIDDETGIEEIRPYDRQYGPVITEVDHNETMLTIRPFDPEGYGDGSDKEYYCLKPSNTRFQ